MKLTKFKIFLIIIATITTARLTQQYLQSQFHGTRVPFLQQVGQNSVLIKWQTLTPQIGLVRYGTNKNSLDLSISENTKNTKHKINLTGLTADTLYFYQINGNNFSFFTAPLKTTKRDLLFWVLGDPGKATDTLKQVKDSGLAWLGNSRLDLMLTTGDNAYSSGKASEYQSAIFNIFGSILTKVGFYPAYGNHDARRFAFFDIFDFPTKGQLGGVPSDSEEYYSFDYGLVHLVFLNSETNPLMPNQAMLDWLERDLSANQNRWTVVLFHSPPYTKGSHNSDSWRDSLGRMVYMREQVLPILEKYDTDLVLSGHSHSYERSHLIRCHYDTSDKFNKKMVLDDDGSYQKNINKTVLDGTVYLVLGNSSKVNYGQFNHPALPIHFEMAGSLMMRVNQTSLSVYFLDKTGVVRDQFLIDKTKTIKRNNSCDATINDEQ